MDSTDDKQIKKRKCKLEEDSPKTGMDRLPQDIALNVLSRLRVTSILQFRFACRAWQMLSHDPHLVNLHLSRTAKKNPCLIFHGDYPIQNQLYFVELSDKGDKETVKRIQNPLCSFIPEFNIVGSCNGLLCLSDSLFNDALYIYNPFTREHKEVPKSIQFEEQEVIFGFGFHPVTNEYKVVKIVYYSNEAYNRLPWRYRRFRIRDLPQSDVQIFSLNSNRWRSIGKVPYQLDRRSSEALVNGRLHWVSPMAKRRGVSAIYLRIIISFDLADEKFREVPRPDCVLPRRDYHLAVLGECLCAAVLYNHARLEIWVMKEYNDKESWIREYNIVVQMPKFISQDLQKSYGIWKNILNSRIVRILCRLQNGEILLEYKGGNLVSYDPKSGTCSKLMFQGMPSLFQAVVHVGSLNWIDSPTDRRISK